MAAGRPRHSPPSQCPTCRGRLAPTAFSCDDCGTEVRGAFTPCDFCRLDADQRHLLRVFLASRGNTKELERHLGVSYPTARARLDGLLATIGIESSPPDPRARRRDLLRAVAEGSLEIDDAISELDSFGPPG